MEFRLLKAEEIKIYLKKHKMEQSVNRAVHVAWATGGRLVPETIREEYKNTYL